MKHGLLAASLALTTLGSCALVTSSSPPLAAARTSADFESYELHRVGLLPFQGRDIDEASAASLQEAFAFELGRSAPFEVVYLGGRDLAEVDADRPFERGAYRARSVIEIARRFRLDGLLVGTVTHLEPYAPQSLGLQLELVATETGTVIWSSSLELDASDRRVQRSLERYREQQSSELGEAVDAHITLLSPARLMRFAASEVARTL